MNSRKPDGRPSWQWYPSDWLEEPGLKLCSLAAKGLWMDLLCYMFKMQNRGYLRIRGKQLGSKEVAQLTGYTEAEAKQALTELDTYGVSETTADGCIYSRRMVRDEKQRQSKVEAGRKGGRVSKPKADNEAKGGSSSPTPSSTPTPTPTEKKNIPIGFAEFWKAYPNRRSKQDAIQSWKRLKPDKDLLETILLAIAKQKLTEQWQRGIYVHPHRWLNKKRWEDEALPAPSQPGKVQPKDPDKYKGIAQKGVKP